MKRTPEEKALREAMRRMHNLGRMVRASECEIEREGDVLVVISRGGIGVNDAIVRVKLRGAP